MIELRPLVNGNYKGLIFCNSIREAEEILKEINVILIKNFNKNLKCKIKRGCSEYYFKFPSYNKLDNTAMSYNSNWKNYEIEFDEKNPDMIFDKISNPTISGISLFDALVFRNWLSYAKMIGDEVLSCSQIYIFPFAQQHPHYLGRGCTFETVINCG